MITWLLACAARNPPELRPRGLEPARSTAEALEAALEPRRVAVLVGVDAFDDPAFPDLVHAGHDADLFAGVLADPAAGGFDDVVKLVGGPSRGDVIETLRRLKDLRHEDVVVVYFAGHGTRVTGADGRPRMFLLQRDSRAADLETTALDLAALQSWFATLAPARKVLVVDACFDGEGRSVLPPTAADGPVAATFLPATQALAAGEAWLFATSPGRPALEDDALGHGVYTYFLIEALSWSFGDADRDGDGVVTAWEAHDFARGRTLERTGGRQVPEAAFRVVGTADVVLAGRSEDRKRRDDALVFLYPPPGHPLSGATIAVDGRPRGALPGTVAIPPGRHHLVLADADGGALAEGHVTLASGRPYRAEDLARLLAGPARGFGVAGVAALADGLPHALTGPAGGVDLHAWARDDRAPGRGLLAGLRLAVLGTTDRLQDDGTVTTDPRWVAELDLDAGVQQDWRRMRLRAAWSLGAVWIPRSWGGDRPAGPIDPATVPAEAGWVFGVTGPALSLGWVGSETWALVAHARPALTVLDPEGDGGARPIPWVSATVGPEVVLR